MSDLGNLTGMRAGTGVEISFTKWGGQPHWRYVMESLGTDEYGEWFGARGGTPTQRGHEPPIRAACDFVSLAPAAGHWIATWNAAGDVAIYVDVTSRPIRDERSVHAVDLDLDVIRRRDGTVQVLDEDEFAEHQVRYRYPADVVSGALRTTGELVRLITARTEPFDQVGDAWLRDFTR
jgi:uncharacterized protein